MTNGRTEVGSSPKRAATSAVISSVVRGRRVHAQIAAAGAHAEVLIGRTADEQRGHLAPKVPPGARLGLEAEAVTWAQQRS